jgi:hypothetical protein
MASNWTGVNLDQMFPQALEDLRSDIQDIIDDIDTLNTAYSSMITLMSAKLDSFLDPFSALTASLVATLKGLADDLRSVPIHMLATIDDLDDPQGYEGFINRIKESVWDYADQFRPTFTSGAWVGGYLIMFGAPSYSEFSDLANPIAKLANVQKWSSLAGMTNVNILSSYTLKNLTYSPNKQTIPISSAANFPRRGGFIKIINHDGDPVVSTTYDRVVSFNSKHYLEGVSLDESFDSGAKVQLMKDAFGHEPKVDLAIALSPSSQPQDIHFSQSTNLFPDTGVASISGERIYYTKIDDNTINGIVTQSHGAGESVLYLGSHPGVAVGPNWQKKQLIDTFDILGDSYRLASQVAQYLAPAENVITMASEFSDMLTEKSVDLVAVFEDLKDKLNFLSTIGSTGTYFLPIAPDTGNPGAGMQGFIEEMENAGGVPPWSSGYFVGGLAIVVGSEVVGGAGGISQYWDTLKILLGD